MIFDKEKQGWAFYNSYAEAMGFNIRRDDLQYEKNGAAVSHREKLKAKYSHW